MQLTVKRAVVAVAGALLIGAAVAGPAVAGRRADTFVSVRLAAIGSTVTSPRGPFAARPHTISFDLGGYYGAGTKGLWIAHLKWVDWGQPVAFASGTVYARVWPTKKYVVAPGGIMLDKLQSCGGHRLYYTSANMVAPTGFPQNSQSTAFGMGEQALTPC